MGRDPNREIAAMRRRKMWNKVAFWSYFTFIALAMISPLSSTEKTIVFVSSVALLLIYAKVLSRVRLWIYFVGKRGEFDRALRLNCQFAWIPGYGDSLEGPILFNAGRYREAQSFLEPLAYDAKGEPRLTSLEFYTYALALNNDGREAEAEKLLEAAVQVPQRTKGIHVALASCLLSQKKDPERACGLMEQALAATDLQSTSYGRDSDRMTRIALYAWALAACGRRPEAEARMQEALAGAASLKDAERAGVLYFAGEAWRAMGEWRKARATFQEALMLSPEGPAATGSQKALKRMREEAGG
jgi:tetratricopeptide (TPR) repeat protein